MVLPGPTGESNELRLHGRGVFVCISPWNFPLAIFAGQVVAALVAGNTVAAKPAEQTPAVARSVRRAAARGRRAGRCAGAAARAGRDRRRRAGGRCAHGRRVLHRLDAGGQGIINRTLAAKDGPIVPLIAETGGINAMMVDSTALPEQVVDAVVQSAFRSAGQRCSALRLLCVHEGIADGVIEMIRGALAELRVGDPAVAGHRRRPGDRRRGARQRRPPHRSGCERDARLIARTPRRQRRRPTHVAPIAFEIDAHRRACSEEIFGPVLHVVRWGGEVDAVVAQINALGYGLTLGIQTRIDSRALRIAERARVGNVYVNRNMIGAVVGVQPFGGEGLSGTGPKAGGPHYLDRFAAWPESAPAAAPPLSWPEVGRTPTLDALADGQAAWAAQTLAARASVLQRAAARLEPAIAAQLRRHAEQATVVLADRSLPGPTGESNTLRLHARGIFAVLAQGAAGIDAAAATAAALLGGNSVALVGAADGEALRGALIEAGLPASALALFDADATGALLRHARVAGVCVAAAGDAALRPVARALAGRDGAILPLISSGEARRAELLWRFCAEQTLTINTAAAGGNAELLASAGRTVDAAA